MTWGHITPWIESHSWNLREKEWPNESFTERESWPSESLTAGIERRWTPPLPVAHNIQTDVTQTQTYTHQTHHYIYRYQHTHTPRGVRGSLNLRVHKLAVEAAWGIPVPCAYAINMWTPVLCVVCVCVMCDFFLLNVVLVFWVSHIHHCVTFDKRLGFL